MKNLKLSFCLLFLLVISSSFPAIGQTETDSPAEELLDISEDAAFEEEQTKKISKSVFDLLKGAIDETYEIDTEIKNLKNPTKEQRYTIMQRVRKLHKIYEEVHKREDYYKKKLLESTTDTEEIVKDSRKLKRKYNSKFEKYQQELQQMKGNSDEKAYNIRAAEMKVELSQHIVKIISEFSKQIEGFEVNHEKVYNDVSNLFEQVKNSYEVTGLMLQVLEIGYKQEEILENLREISNIDAYIKQMNDSLQNLAKSLINLQKTADKIGA